MLTASIHYIIPSLIGRGLTESQARSALARARVFGSDTVRVGNRVLPVVYTQGKFTVGPVK